MFEVFVRETLWLYVLIVEYNWIFAILYFACSTYTFAIFVFHETNYKDMEFFVNNVEDLYDFSMTRWRINKTLFATILPLAFIVIVWSLFERFDSRKFLLRYG